MAERQYSDDEVAEILRRAIDASQAAASTLPPTPGLTLAQLQEIGREVGVTPEVIADAARSLARQEPRFRQQLLGLTVGVGRTVSLDRQISDAEWERLVTVLRDTFDARGRLRVDGSLREWTNGNLQILIEPTDHGDRLRMRTVNAAARALINMSVFLGAVSVVLTVVALATDPASLPERGSAIVALAGGAVTSAALGLRRIRGWAATRLAQMDDVARRLTGGS